MLLKLMVDRNLENLVHIIENAKGNLYLEMENQDKMKLKGNAYQDILKEKVNAREDIKIHVYHVKDYFDLVYYHIGLNF